MGMKNSRKKRVEMLSWTLNNGPRMTEPRELLNNDKSLASEMKAVAMGRKVALIEWSAWIQRLPQNLYRISIGYKPFLRTFRMQP